MKPRYVIDLDLLEKTARIAKGNADRLGVRLLMALKSFPLPSAFPTLAPFVEGWTASGLYEARLPGIGFPSLRHEVHVHAPAYVEEEMPAVLATCSHVVFNSLAQLKRFGAAAKARGARVGLRVNPGFSSADCLAYDPCCPDSRFGVLWEELRGCDAGTLRDVDGLHLHALCEGGADDFAELVERVSEQLRLLLEASALVPANLAWINLGGGEVICDPDFSSPRACQAVRKLKGLLSPDATPVVYIEPSEYLVRYSGFLEAHVLDVIHREKDIAILDVSGSCHATDLLLFRMMPEIVAPPLAAEGADGSSRRTILGCVSCLAGDVLGEVAFERPLQVGDTVVFGGLGSYTFAQQSWFNGIRHPDIVLRSAAEGERTVLTWGFDDFLRDFHRQRIEPGCDPSSDGATATI